MALLTNSPFHKVIEPFITFGTDSVHTVYTILHPTIKASVINNVMKFTFIAVLALPILHNIVSPSADTGSCFLIENVILLTLANFALLGRCVVELPLTYITHELIYESFFSSSDDKIFTILAKLMVVLTLSESLNLREIFKVSINKSIAILGIAEPLFAFTGGSSKDTTRLNWDFPIFLEEGKLL